MHGCGGSTSPGSTILPDVFGIPAPSDKMFKCEEDGVYTENIAV
jgi:hypothetical protein